jgi:hypothetical protein
MKILNTLRDLPARIRRFVTGDIKPFDNWLDGEKAPQKGEKLKVVYVIGVWDNTNRLVRLATRSFDHLKANLFRFDESRIFYIARRWGQGMKEINAYAVNSEQTKQKVRKKEEALYLLSQVVMNDPR